MSLAALPDEVLVLIAKHVVISDAHFSLWQIGQLARTNVALSRVCKERSVWRHVCAVLVEQHSQSAWWHALVASYLDGTLQHLNNWPSILPWKCARLSQRYGDTLLCELDATRRLRVLAAPENMHNNELYIISVRRTRDGRASRIGIGLAGEWPQKERHAVQNLEAHDFGWRVSKHVPRSFWCDPNTSTTQSFEEFVLTRSTTGERTPAQLAKDRRIWISANSRPRLKEV